MAAPFLNDHHRFYEIIESFADPLVFLDSTLVIRYANQSFFDQFRYDYVDVVFNSFLNLLDEADQATAGKNLKEVLAVSGSVTRFEVSFRHRDEGVRYLDVSAKNIDNQNSQPMIVLSLKDITSRKEAEAERERLQAQLIQAQKLEAIGRLAGSVAHDFNNMLVVIIGHVEILAAKLPPDSLIHNELIPIMMAAQRSADLTRQLLAFARKQVVAPKLLDLNHCIATMLPMLNRLVGEDVNLTWQSGSDLSLVLMDPSQVDQVLMNLCVNARDAIDGNGAITIRSEMAEFDETFCANHVGFLPGRYTAVAVGDDGCGMDAETLSHIFEPFFTTKDANKGTGLGLSTVYGMVKQNNGFISVQSELGKGTIFTIFLPAHAPELIETAQDPKVTSVPSGRGTILLVEDELAVLMVTSQILEGLGYRVLTADAPSKALEMAKEHADAIDLLITDVVLPEVNGRELARTLAGLYPNLKQLFISGYTANVIAQHGVLEPDVEFLQKPFSRRDLAAKIESIMTGTRGT
ncbi:hypothetical protein GMLC_06310 [Geomonas limicola]|uniref:histidine kinase n=1 Tax=Geomonas limicola TaxID=2740186 RepID=A0A6V8N3D0_9BACT|nr:ATP-binding protein [Geomonas limicola]GFO67052.1 hypothetical protein GMLC_06310 [Geomonas limicola]